MSNFLFRSHLRTYFQHAMLLNDVFINHLKYKQHSNTKPIHIFFIPLPRRETSKRVTVDTDSWSYVFKNGEFFYEEDEIVPRSDTLDLGDRRAMNKC